MLVVIDELLWRQLLADEAFTVEVLGEPDKTGTEHGVGCGEEVELERFDGGAGFDDFGFELFGDFGLGGGLNSEFC